MEKDFNSIMQRYKEELMRFDEMQREAAKNTEIKLEQDRENIENTENVENESMTEEMQNSDSQPQTRITTLQPQGQPEIDNPALQKPSNQTDNITEDTDKGGLIVYVTSLLRTTPIADADVVVYKELEGKAYLLWHGKTNAMGYTETFMLPAPPRSISESPSSEMPYAVYSVRISAPGFYMLNNIDAQVFGGQNSVIEANMIPVSVDSKNISNELTVQTPPSSLLDS